ncbi:MAG: response regulator [Rhodopirellula sp.]|nr:response regulator [Rhodopirellula sp.]
MEIPISSSPVVSPTRMHGCVHVVDDELFVRESVQLLATSMNLPCETYESAEDFTERFRPGSPGCLVVDLFLTGRNGFSLLREYSDPRFLIPAIAISGSLDSRLSLRAIQEGAVTFLNKDCEQQELGRAISMCLRLANDAESVIGHERPLQAGLEQLSNSEKVVLDHLIQGMPNRAIAKALNVSERTLERRRASLLSKLNARSAAEAAHMVGLVSREEGVLRRRWPVPAELLAGVLSDDDQRHP